MRRRWIPGPALTHPFGDEIDRLARGGNPQPNKGAHEGAQGVLGQDETRRGDRFAPVPFDFRAQVAPVVAGGTLIYDARAIPTTGLPSGTQAFMPVPHDYRGGVHAIATYLRGGTSVLPPGHTPPDGTDVTLSWSVLVDGVPVAGYDSITQVLGEWDAPPSPFPLIEIPEDKALSVRYTYSDPNDTMLYSLIGIRLIGRLLPWNWKGHLP